MQANLFTFSFKILKILAFLLGLLPIIWYTGNKFENASQYNIINKHTEQRFIDFYAQPENTIDIIFVGSSHSYCTFDPEIIDARLGTLSFQMGTPLQNPDTTYYLLEEIFKYQKPGLIVYEIYWDMINKEFNFKQANTLFEVLKDDQTKNKFIMEAFPLDDKVNYYFKPIRYQQDYLAYKNKVVTERVVRRFNVSKKTISRTGKEEYRSKGFVYCDYIIPEDKFYKTNQFLNFDAKKWSFDPRLKKFIIKAVELARSNNSEIVFVTAPVANVSMEHIKNYELIHKQISDFASQLNVDYLDFNLINQKENILQNDNFRDDAHLNYSGVEIVGKYFIDWIIKRSII